MRSQKAGVRRASRTVKSGSPSTTAAGVSTPTDRGGAGGTPSGSRPTSSGLFRIILVTGTITARMRIPMNIVVVRNPCESIPKARAGTRKPPMWTPLIAVAMAIDLLRMNQLLTSVIMASHPLRPEPTVTTVNAA